MAQVEVIINGRDYQIACGDGEEGHVNTLLAIISSHVDNLANEVGQVGQSTLLLFAALMLADELDEIRGDMAGQTVRFAEQADAEATERNRQAGNFQAIAELAGRIDKVAEKLENA